MNMLILVLLALILFGIIVQMLPIKGHKLFRLISFILGMGSAAVLMYIVFRAVNYAPTLVGA